MLVGRASQIGVGRLRLHVLQQREVMSASNVMSNSPATSQHARRCGWDVLPSIASR